jgi:flavin reductase (DIM6/NTAB) family NADH-FMN oxidoreductase RutF
LAGSFVAVNPEKITDNVFEIVGSDWMLVTAGTLGDYNTMTASWGTMGVLWGKRICICFIRPSRYTYQFMEKNPLFTLSFFGEEQRDALNFCGSHSGRDVDKAAETGLIPVEAAGGAVTFEQARLVMVCRKIYYQDFDPSHFIAPDIESNYGGSDYHRIYIGELKSCLVRK